MLFLEPKPGYVICKPYTIETKTGNFHLPKEEDAEKAPEYGEVLEVGPLLPEKQMPYDAKYIPKIGDKICYKRYNYFTLQIGTKKYVAVHFDNIILTITEDEKDKIN